MVCPNCGVVVRDNSKFCEACGAALREQGPQGSNVSVAAAPSSKPAVKRKAAARNMGCDEDQVGPRVVQTADGMYRWSYEVNLYRNPAVLFLVWKIFFFILLGIFLVIIISDLINWGTGNLLDNLKFFGLFLAGVTVLVVISYLIYALIMGGSYKVIFEMNDRGINHRQLPSQARKAGKLGKAVSVVGAATGNAGVAGLGMNAQRTEMYSEFIKVRTLIGRPARNLIKVNGLLSHNQVYVAREDYPFVYHYIATRCVNSKQK